MCFAFPATYAVAAAVSLLPASLPAVVALSLATASKTLAASNALVRRMDAIETLSAVTDVCSDKTGTITLGKMVMQKAWIPATFSRMDAEAKVTVDTREGQMYAVETGSDPYYPRGRVMAIGPDEKGQVFGDDDDDTDPARDYDLVDKDSIEPPLRDFTLCASLCNSATVQRSHNKEDEGKGRWEAHGDATEVALQVVSLYLISITARRTPTNVMIHQVRLQSRTWSTSSYSSPQSQPSRDNGKRSRTQDKDSRSL